MKDKIDNLIRIGESFNFHNNSYSTSHGIYTKASSDLLSWITEIEDFVLTNYGEDSAPFKLYQTFSRLKLNGYEKDDFDEEKEKLIGVLKACKTISPKKNKTKDDNLIISLLKNPIFWTVMVIVIGASFTLGIYFGSTKFDKEKAEYYEQIKILEKELERIKSVSE